MLFVERPLRAETWPGTRALTLEEPGHTLGHPLVGGQAWAYKPQEHAVCFAHFPGTLFFPLSFYLSPSSSREVLSSFELLWQSLSLNFKTYSL